MLLLLIIVLVLAEKGKWKLLRIHTSEIEAAEKG